MRLIFVIFLCYLVLVCQPASAETKGMLERHLKSNRQQKYYIFLPKNYDPTLKYPLFIGIQWADGTAKQQINQ